VLGSHRSWAPRRGAKIALLGGAISLQRQPQALRRECG
jgi:hypothetical protein